MKSFFVGIKNVLLWSYERGTWQYDLLCLLIIATIFLIPGKYFGDRDRVGVKPSLKGEANELAITASKPGEMVREIAVGDLQAFLQKQGNPEMLLNSPKDALTLYLRNELKQDVVVSNFEPYMNPQGRVGYRVWIK